MDCGCVGAGRTTRDLDVCVDAGVGTRRKSLEFAEIRMLKWSSKLRQSVPKSLPEPLVRWLVLEMLPEVDLSFRPRAPEFMATWV